MTPQNQLKYKFSALHGILDRCRQEVKLILKRSSTADMLSTDEDMHDETPSTQDSEADVNRSAASTIRLIVGPAKQRFELPEDLINRCPHFLNTFTGNYVEAKTKTAVFPDDDPQHFHDLCEWLKHGDLASVNPEPTWIWLAKVWLFAQKYTIDELQNEAMNALHAKFAAALEGVNISFETLDYVAENTFPRSPLRRIFSDMLTNGISLQQLPNRVENIPHEFLQDMCIALKTTVQRNDPTYTSLLTNPISTYYVSSSSAKATAMPRPVDSSEVPTNLYCQSNRCLQKPDQQPIKDVVHICTNHNLTLCAECKNEFHGHSKKTISLTTAPYRDAITGVTIIDGHANDHGFWCDGPRCDGRAKAAARQDWALMSGDRYHCLVCRNVDYCSVCIRGSLSCKEEEHQMLRIRATHAKKLELTTSVTIKQRQERFEQSLCWRCGSSEHETDNCEANEVPVAEDLRFED